MTIYDIAKAAGVSPATVSRVINGSDKVTKKTREKIEAIMKENHYVVNTTAKSLVSRRSQTVGVIVPDLHNSHYLDAAEEINQFFEEKGFACILRAAGKDGSRHGEVLRLLAERQIDGLIMVGSYFQNEVVHRALELYFPSIPVLLVYGELDLPNVITAQVDEVAAAKEATMRLLESGHRHLVYVKNGDCPSIRRKVAGYFDACHEAKNVEARVWHIEGNGYDGIRDSIQAIFTKYPETNGIVFSNDFLAVIGGRMLSDMGYQVPEKVSYISFYNCGLSRVSNPQLTSVDVRIRDLARAGCERMMECFDGTGSYQRIDLPYRIVDRETT